MSLFTIDRSKCTADQACVLECPLGIIVMDKRGNFPVPVSEAERFCINCGHCVAVCPQGAFSLSTMPSGNCQDLLPGWRLSPEQVEHLLKGRRSIRTYKKDPVEREILEKLIDVSRFAPSGINRQPVEWVVIHDSGKVHAIAQEVIVWMKRLIEEGSPMAESLHLSNRVSAWENGKDYICRGAPHLLLACALKADVTAQAACIIASVYAELSAVSFGLGTCWAGYVQMALAQWLPLQRMLGLSQRRGCFGALMIGYPRFNYARIPLRNKARVVWK